MCHPKLSRQLYWLLMAMILAFYQACNLQYQLCLVKVLCVGFLSDHVYSCLLKVMTAIARLNLTELSFRLLLSEPFRFAFYEAFCLFVAH